MAEPGDEGMLGVLLEYKLSSPDMAPALAPQLGTHEAILSQPHVAGLQLGLPGLEEGEEEGALKCNLRHSGPLQKSGR